MVNGLGDFGVFTEEEPPPLPAEVGVEAAAVVAKVNGRECC